MAGPIAQAKSDRLDLFEQVGGGGNASVYRARLVGHPGHVAAKVLNRRLSSPAERRRFGQECHALRQLAGVEGIVRILDAWVEPDGRAYLVTDLYSSTCADRLRSLGWLTEAEVIDIGKRAANALAAAHADGILHGDVKPSNLLLAANGKMALGDFGASTFAGDQTDDGALSTGYVAPEVVETGERSVAADIYSLGVTLYQLATGRPPTDETFDFDGISTPLTRLICRMLADKPQRRPSSAEEVARELAEIETNATNRKPLSALNRISRTPLYLAGGLVAVVLAAYAITTLFGDGSQDIESNSDELGSLANPTSSDQAAVVENAIGRASDETESTPPDPDTLETATSDSNVVTELPGPSSGSDSSPSTSTRSATDQSQSSTTASDTTSPPNTAPASTPPRNGPDCTDTVLCESFDDGLGGWEIRGVASAARIAATVEGFSDGGVEIGPAQPVDGAQRFMQRPVGTLPDGRATVSLRILVTEPGQDDYWMNVAEIRDSLGRQWSVHINYASSSQFSFSVNHWDRPTDDFVEASSGLYPLNRWFCLELDIDPAATQSLRLDVDGRRAATLNQSFPDRVGTEHILSLGPTWATGELPTMTLDNVVVEDYGDSSC